MISVELDTFFLFCTLVLCIDCLIFCKEAEKSNGWKKHVALFCDHLDVFCQRDSYFLLTKTLVMFLVKTCAAEQIILAFMASVFWASLLMGYIRMDLQTEHLFDYQNQVTSRDEKNSTTLDFRTSRNTGSVFRLLPRQCLKQFSH
jgi:hypothetical protein